MEFKSGVKTSKDDKKVKVLTYELGGGRAFANLLESAIAGGSIHQTTVVIVIDLSKSGEFFNRRHEKTNSNIRWNISPKVAVSQNISYVVLYISDITGTQSNHNVDTF